MEKKLIEAPIDEKNVSSDWITDIFDNFNSVTNGKTFVGFVKDVPVSCDIDGNRVYWRMSETYWTYDAWRELNGRLRVADNENPDNLVIEYEYNHSQAFILQKFFFTED